MTAQARLAWVAFGLALMGVIVCVTLVVLFALDLLGGANTLWVAVASFAFELPALVLGLRARDRVLGRIAVAVSCLMLIATVVGLALFYPAQVERGQGDAPAVSPAASVGVPAPLSQAGDAPIALWPACCTRTLHSPGGGRA